MNNTTTKVSSRASIKIGDSYYTFEATIERTISNDVSDEEYAQFKKDLWNEANSEVDAQIEETVEFLKKRK